jgi:hypothetical protein
MNRRSTRKMTFTSLDALEDRLALSATPVANPLEALVDMKSSPVVGEIYTEFVNYFQAGSHGAFVSPQAAQVEMAGNAVGVDIRFSSGNFATNEAQMQQLGMLVTATAPSVGIVEGFLPIAVLPSVAMDPNAISVTPVLKPTQSAIPPASQVPLVALKGGPALGSIYQEFVNFEQAGGTGTFRPVEAGQILFAGDAVGVDIRTSAANFNTMLGEMEQLGMQVTATAPQVGVIEGFLPIAQLPTVAGNAGLAGMNPIYKPTQF